MATIQNTLIVNEPREGIARCGKCHCRLSKAGTREDPGSYDQRDWFKADGALCHGCGVRLTATFLRGDLRL